MGSGDCGNDSNGRPIGYVFEATCDHDECEKGIHRGLSYACGGMHGENGFDCEKYFCCSHKDGYIKNDDGDVLTVCRNCERLWRQECPDEAKAFDEEGFTFEGNVKKG